MTIYLPHRPPLGKVVGAPGTQPLVPFGKGPGGCAARGEEQQVPRRRAGRAQGGDLGLPRRPPKGKMVETTIQEGLRYFLQVEESNPEFLLVQRMKLEELLLKTGFICMTYTLRFFMLWGSIMKS